MKSVKYLLAFAVLIALFAVINNQETSSFIEKKGTYSNENALKKLLDVTHKEDEEPVDDEDEDEDDLDYEEEDDDVLVLNNYTGRAKNHTWAAAWQKVSAGSAEYNYGHIRFVLSHMRNKQVAAGDDEVAYVFIKAAEDAAEGTFAADVYAVHWSTGIVGGVGDGDGPTSKFNITITSSGIQDVTSANVVKAQKVIENGQIYIIASDKKYNVMGAEVK